MTPPKKSTKSSYPLLKTPKNIEIQNFEPQKIARAYVFMQILEFPPGVQVSNLKIEVTEYGKKGLKMAWNAFSEK